MFALLNPAALLALTGLLVPVAIHLWNRRPGREVAVGSLRWLTAGANRRLRNLKLEQLWLLLLRAALLAVLAVAVAGPVWQQPQLSSRGVVLLSPEVQGLPALAALKPTIDSLRRRGYGLRWLAAGFPRLSGSRWRAAGQPGAADSAGANLNATFTWARVQQAVAVFPGQPLLVVTSARLRNLSGSHAPLPPGIRWQALPDTSSASWLAAAHSFGDSLQLLVGHSREAGTTYRREKVREQHHGQLIRVPGLAPVRFLSDKEGRDYFVLAPTGAQRSDYQVDVGIPPLVIDVYATPEFAADARYLEAALRAVALGMPIPPQLRRVSAPPRHLTGWTFWLSAEPLPAGLREDLKTFGSHLWQEAADVGVADTSTLVTESPSASVRIFRRGTGRVAVGQETLWADGLGRPVLSRQALGRGGIYQLHTRLSPAWSQLADDPELPARLLALLQPEATDATAPILYRPRNLALEQRLQHFDRRVLDPSQLTAGPRLLPTNAPVQPMRQRITELRPWLVLVAGLLFLLERLLARRRENRILHPTL
ncbi:BatA domain-containing protein [Hymenobacter properus]|uniref:BatA domain-containing protein n=1 Tax=Hymenobacter properus TaxID=2791026 RepID=A0A931BHP2_9BACT|nr:BatA domain-containing protein [Hymenobacter properus]MBF9144125.1 BatA domain-containing protein [Hymenobacter properus]MBR7722941.1 BatA domain-containing protein [Microvirga sp. SRT04]